MADLSIQDPEVRNFHAVCRAFVEIGNSLEEYTEKKLTLVHQRIYKKLAGYTECTDRCSEKYKRQINSWCPTCTAWKRELMSTLRHGWKKPSVKWERMESWNWSQKFDTILAIYLPTDWSVGPINIADIATAVSIWDNCDGFDIQRDIITKIRKHRNSFAHNPKGKVTEAEAGKVFTLLKSLLRQQDVKDNHSDVQRIETRLDNIETNMEIKTVSDIGKDIASIKGYTKEILSELKRPANDAQDKKMNKPPRKRCISVIAALFLLEAIGVFFLVCHLINPFKLWTTDISLEAKGCVSELYSVPWETDITLLENLRGHEKLIGRKWLFEEMEGILLEGNASNTGLVLVAEMGYGKSAIAFHLICADRNSQAWKIRRRIIAFHVCRFDALVTRTPDVFIRRLVGMLGNEIPEFGSVVSVKKSGSHWFYDGEKCRFDPVGCFRHLFIYRLKEITYTPDEPWIILIDALDECTDENKGSNEILDLIKSVSLELPGWLRFLVTTRNTTTIHTAKEFRIISLFSDDGENIADVMDYVSQSNISVKLKSDIDYIINQSPNFLLVVNVLQYWEEEDTASDIPLTLERIYELNFIRVYGANEERFADGKFLLEVMCASLDNVGENELYNISSYHQPMVDKIKFVKSLQVLSNFVKRHNKIVSFAHISLYHWLVDPQRAEQPFYIDKQRGHQLWASYLINTISKNTSLDIIDIAAHVSFSEAANLTQDMHNLSIWNDSIQIKFILHRLALRLDSYSCTRMVLQHVENIDERNAWNATASFIAAKQGHRETLLALLENGAELSVRLNDLPVGHVMEGEGGLVFLCKYVYYCKYSLMDIASQEGHHEVVELLLSRHRSLASHLNGVNLKPIHLACERGHIQVVKLFLKLDTSLADQICLHHAAANGHLQIVELMVALGVHDACLECSNSAYWVQANKTRLHFTRNETDASMYVVHNFTDALLYDDWWRILCETALHAAIRGKHADVVKTLTLKGNGNLHCRDRNGYTPFLLAVKLNAVDMLPVSSLESFARNKCYPFDTANTEFLSHEEREGISSSNCRPGSTIAHLISQYNCMDIADYLISHGLEIAWNSKDDARWLPMHTAIYYNHVNIVRFLCSNSSSQVETRNGSNILHFAAQFGSLELIKLLALECLEPISLSDVDKNKRGILFYALLKPLPAISSKHTRRQVFKLVKYLLNEIKQNVTYRDAFGKNILHYVLARGHYDVLEYLHSKFFSTIAECVSAKDRRGMTPLDKAIDMLNRNSDTLMLNCSIYELFTDSCTVKMMETFLNPEEYGIILYLELFAQYKPLMGIKFHHLETVVQKSNLFLTVYFLRNIRWSITVENNPLASNIAKGNMDEMIILAWTLLRPRDLIYCGVPIEKSPAHYILSRFSSFSFTEIFLKEVIFSSKTSKLNNCLDDENFSILHRAIQGGNFKAVELLYNTGLDVTTHHMPIGKVLLLPLVNVTVPPKYNEWRERIVNNVKHNISTEKSDVRFLYKDTLGQSLDKIMSFLINKMRLKIVEEDLCRKGEISFSLVHLIAANGMTSALKTIRKHWGKSVLKCRNFHNITPVYLATVMNQNDTATYLKDAVSEIVSPSFSAKVNLHFKLSSGFYDLENSIFSCLYRIRKRLTFYQRMVFLRCLEKLKTIDIIYENITRTVKEFHCVTYKVSAMLCENAEKYYQYDELYSCSMDFLETVWRRHNKMIVFQSINALMSHTAVSINLNRSKENLIFLVDFKKFNFTFSSGNYGRVVTKHHRFIYMDLLKFSFGYRAWLHDKIDIGRSKEAIFGRHFDILSDQDIAMHRVTKYTVERLVTKMRRLDIN